MFVLNAVAAYILGMKITQLTQSVFCDHKTLFINVHDHFVSLTVTEFS